MMKTISIGALWGHRWCGLCERHRRGAFRGELNAKSFGSLEAFLGDKHNIMMIGGDDDEEDDDKDGFDFLGCRR